MMAVINLFHDTLNIIIVFLRTSWKLRSGDKELLFKSILIIFSYYSGDKQLSQLSFYLPIEFKK